MTLRPSLAPQTAAIKKVTRRTVLRTAALSTSAFWLHGARALGPADSDEESSVGATYRAQCEFIDDPLGLQESRPYLAWMKTDSESGGQIAFRVTVSSTPTGRPDLWDSGRVASAAPGVLYGGRSLAPHQSAYWKVCVWSSGESAPLWSTVNRWSVGPRNESDWEPSVWIGRDVLLESTQDKMPGLPGPVPEPNFFPAPYLRKTFDLSAPVRSAILYACGLGFAELHLNGERVGTTERDPGFTNFDRSVLYVTHDVTPHLRQGRNALGAILGTGWYDTHDVATWHFNTAPWRQRPRLRLLLVIDLADGSRRTVVSDASWRAASGPILRDGVYTGEVYDARLENHGWAEAKFDDSGWKSVLIVEAPRGRLRPLLCPPVRVGRTITPVAITEPKPGVFIVDMGENFSGHTQLHVKGPAGHAITMRYAEVLNADGTLNSKPIDHFMEETQPRQPFQQDTYLCRGSGEVEVWEQRFSWSGFQYVEVTNFPGTPTLDNFRGRFAHTDLETAGEFSCSDETANLVQRAVRQSFLSNAQSYPTDCPQREKNGWTGDAGLAVEAGLFNFDSVSFYLKWLDDFAEAQRPDGGLPVLVPNGGWGNGERWPGPICPPWDAAYPIITWETYRATGDARILARHIEPLRRYANFFLSFRGADGLAPALGLGDWSPFKAVTDQDYITNAYLYLVLGLVAKMYRALDQRAPAKRYEDLAEQQRTLTHSRFYSPATHRYSNGTQMAQGMALYFDLAPRDERKLVFDDLVGQIESLGHLDVGFLGAKFVTRALAEGGRADLAYRVCMQPSMPSYGYIVKTMKSTTLWEGWKAGPSYNHIMFGDISAWMVQWLAGIQQSPEGSGFAKIVFRPTPIEGLTHAMASYRTPRGRVQSSWARDGKDLNLELTVPPGAEAQLNMPPGWAYAQDTTPPAKLGGGMHRFRLRRA